MNTFQCTNCGFQIQRPTQPYSCPQCGRQAIGLFRLVGYVPPAQGPAAQGPWPGQPGVPPQGMPPAQQPGPWPQQPATWPAQGGMPPAQAPGPWPQQPAMPQQPGPWPGQQGMPPQQQPGPWPQQPTMPPAQQPGGWPRPPAQQPGPWPQQPGAWPQQPGVPPAQPGIPAGPPGGRPYQPGIPPAARGAYPPPQAAPPGQPALPPGTPPGQHSQPRAPRPGSQRAAPPASPGQSAPPAAPPVVNPPASAAKRPPAPPPKAPRPSQPQTPAAGPAAPAAPRKAPGAPPAEPGKRRPAPAKSRAYPATPVRRTPRPRPPRPEQFLWAFPEQPVPEDQAVPLRCAPAVDEAGRIFLHLRGRLFAIEESEGKPKILWEYVTGKHVPGPVVLGPNQSVLLHATDGYLHCLDAATGKQNWPPACVGEPLGYAAPVVDDEGNTWLSGFDGGILKVDAGGHLQKPGPFLRSRQKFDSAAILVGGVLYAAAESGYVFAIQAEGERGVNLWKHAGDHGFAGWCVHSAPAMTDDNVLILPGHDDLLCGFADGGLPVFKTSMPGQMLGSPVLDRYGHIYVGVSQLPRGFESRGLLVCLDGNSHMIRWEYRAAGAVESTPVIGDDDVIYFGDNAGVVHAVDLLGNGLWTADLGPPVRGAGTIPASGRVAFGLDDETLVVLKCSSTGLAPAGWPKLGRTLGQSGTK